MEKFPYREPTNIRPHSLQFRGPGDLVTGICLLLPLGRTQSKCLSEHRNARVKDGNRLRWTEREAVDWIRMALDSSHWTVLFRSVMKLGFP
jgi:hypothetical protein